MQYRYIPYIWLLIVSAFVSLALGVYALLMKRKARGVTAFVFSMFVVTIWSAGNALEMSAVDFSTKLFWANIQYFAYCYSPVTLLALCMQFTGYDKWIENKKILWIAIIPTIIIILVWTDRLHGLIRYDMNMDYSGIFPVISKKYGPVFYVHAVYSHLLNIIAWVLVIRAVFLKNTVYRRQALALFFGISLIVLPNIMYISNIGPFKRFDITPVFFGPAGMIIAWGIFRFKLFDLIPLARATVIETMDAGIMVLDLQDRVLDVNPAFQRIIGISASQISAKWVEEACSKIPELVNACMDRSITETEFCINEMGTSKIYEALISPLTDDKGKLMGRLLVAYDITEKKQAQQEFLRQQRKLAVIEERERMARDMHDNLGQVLGFINLQAQGVRQELKNSGIEIAGRSIDKLVDATQSAHKEIREYIINARNMDFLEKDLVSALRKNIIAFREQTGIAVREDIPIGFTGEELEPGVVLNILNIVKEALNNVRKHAQASHIKIGFSVVEEQLYITIEDNGRGFENIQNTDSRKNKFGLNIMKERASEMGGQLDINSVLGEGCRISLHVPLRKGDKIYETDAGR